MVDFIPNPFLESVNNEMMLTSIINGNVLTIGDGNSEGINDGIYGSSNHSIVLQEWPAGTPIKNSYTKRLYHADTKRSKQADIEIRKDAEAAGLEIIGDGKNGHYKMYRFIKCGHIQSIKTSEVRRNSFQCRQCKSSHWDQEKSLYLFEIECEGQSWLKLGIAKNVESRGKNYGLPKLAETHLLYEFRFNNGYAALELEAQIKKQFETYRLSGKEMKGFHSISGFNECYNIKVKTKLLDRLKEETKFKIQAWQ